MDKFKKVLVGCALAASFATPSANAFLGGDFFLNPYVAAEAAWRTMDWETNYGENHFREHSPNVNFILGTQFHTFFAIEGGFQASDRREMKSFYAGNGLDFAAPALGFVDPLFESSTHHADSEIKGWHLNLVGLLPVLPSTTLYASLGAAWMRFYANTVPTTATNPAQPIAHLRSNHKAVFRFGLGVKQMITEHFGARVFFNWENTNKLEATTVGQFIDIPVLASDSYLAKAKNSHLFGLGFFYQLCPTKV